MSDVELIDSNTWNSLTMCLKWIIGITLKYLQRFDCAQINE